MIAYNRSLSVIGCQLCDRPDNSWIDDSKQYQKHYCDLDSGIDMCFHVNFINDILDK
jgi:hypothetical protein